jgi:hypothetical protein
MNFAFTRELEVEINEIDLMYQKSLQIWWEDLASLRGRLQDDKSLRLMPAVVMLAYKYLDLDHTTSIDMASLFKTLYLANLIHKQVKDEEEGQLNNQDLQFTILIGDYIFGRVLKLLLEIGAVQVLDNLAALMCQISEGLVMEYKLKQNQLEVSKSGNVSFYAIGFLSAARLKGLNDESIELYEQLGFNIGLTMELLIIGNVAQAKLYIEKSVDVLAAFQAKAGFANGCLDKLLQDLAGEIPAVYISAAI